VGDVTNGAGFASDNHAGAHPAVLEAMVAASVGHAAAYGHDEWTARAEEDLRRHFGAGCHPFVVFNGTGANVASIAAVTRSREAVICTDVAHLHLDECGAAERMSGTKLFTMPALHGKLSAADIGRWDARRGDEHFAQPRVVSITQATELGTVYTPAETQAIADAAHERGMSLHIDGARLANAAASLGLPLRALTTDVGVDVVSFGATKNGLVFGEAVIFCRPELAEGFQFVRKQLGQLASKMRFASAQLSALLTDDLWLRNADHANRMAARLATAVEPLDGMELAHPVEANAVFARLERSAIDRLLSAWPSPHPFHVWDPEAGVCRWMCAWDTQPEDVDAFAEAVRAAVAG
jgi:threonine aldolase